MKTINFFWVMLLTFSATAQNVNIPDTNFRNALLAHGNTITGTNISNIDTNNDSLIQVSEALAYSGTINVSNQNISDLTGIEAFTTLTRLYCFNNSITSIDASQNTDLISLLCYNNNIDSLNVTQNPDLVRLECYHNPLNSLDVSQNTALTWLACHNNTLTSLDVSQNPLISRLHCDNNSLTSLDVSHMNDLTWLYCHNNNLTNLDVSQNTSLYWLICGDNSLTTLNISQNIALDELYCAENSLTTLDASQNIALTKLDCRHNSLESINVANGNNGNTSSHLSYMRVQSNPTLSCIQHDVGFDPTTAAGWQKDSTATWSDICCNPMFVTDTQEQCESFTWTDGVTYTQDTIGIQDTLVSTTGCDSIVTLNLTIHSAPTVSLTFLNDELIVTGADSIEWYFDGNLIPNENNDTLVPLNNGGYYVIGYSENGCSSISNAISVAGLSVEENSWNNFKMYPNPTNGTVEIQSDAMISTIEIINNLGQKVGDFSQNQFDISNLKNGVYFVKVTTEIGTSTKRLIKQ